MAAKKFLALEGLEKYNTNWHNRLASMTISDAEIDNLCSDTFGNIEAGTGNFQIDQTETWSNLPIQNNKIKTSETIYLAFGNSFIYEPAGDGIKRISIVNSRGNVNPKKFRLELIDGGEFPIEWASNIRWKNNAVPEFIPYKTDILMFETSDNGETWVGEVTQTTSMTPFWKFSVYMVDDAEEAKYWFNINEEYTYVGNILVIPINKEAIEYVDWGDGTIDQAPFSSYQTYTTIEYDRDETWYWYHSDEDDLNTEAYDGRFLYHEYDPDSPDMYHVEIRSTKFNTGYFLSSNSYPTNDIVMRRFIDSLIRVHNPLPQIKGLLEYQYEEMIERDNTLENIFQNYTQLQIVPNKLLMHNPTYPVGKDSLLGTMIRTVPDHIFDNDIITSFANTFKGNNNIEYIPEDLFDKHPTVTDFSSCFYNCRSLKSIPAKLFEKNTAATTFVNCFYNCVELKSIPAGLFDKNTAATDFSMCFYNCTSIRSIPAELFDKNTSATDFGGCFWKCEALKAIPAGLFDNNALVDDFGSCFSDCLSLKAIPAGLFDKNTAVTTFTSCFYYCKALTSIPSELFDKNTAVTNFGSCFYGCSSLESIPSGLFDKNTAATSFASCFYGCSSLESIPSGLFDKNTAATSFSNCFNGCISLLSIPSNLFIYNTVVTSFWYTFYNCTALNDFSLHIRSASATDVSRFVTKKDDTNRILYVPSGSTTLASFNSVASDLGLVIMTE